MAALLWLPPTMSVGRRSTGPWAGLGPALAPLVLTMAVERLLVRPRFRIGRAWAYRLAFLLSAGLGAGVWAYQALTLPAGAPIGRLGAILLGAFAGALAVTVPDTGLWEDSFPPPPAVREAVLRHHQQTIGEPPAGPRLKRVFDIALALITILLTAPLLLLCALLVWFEDPGPIFFVKNSTGRGGGSFHQIKLRSMVRNAEAETGPIPARKEGDRRTLRVGRIMRKAALDELPQLLNILRGEMSFVGPRPLRTVVIHEVLQEIPQFAERHRVRPGIAGLSQVRGGYYVTPLQRLRYDRVYVNNAGLRLDITLLLQGLLIVFWLRWRKGARREKLRRWM